MPHIALSYHVVRLQMVDDQESTFLWLASPILYSTWCLAIGVDWVASATWMAWVSWTMMRKQDHLLDPFPNLDLLAVCHQCLLSLV